MQKTVWERFGCAGNVIIHEDKDGDEVAKIFGDLAQENFDEFEFMVVCILAHGDKINEVEYIMGIDGRKVDFK